MLDLLPGKACPVCGSEVNLSKWSEDKVALTLNGEVVDGRGYDVGNCSVFPHLKFEVKSSSSSKSGSWLIAGKNSSLEVANYVIVVTLKEESCFVFCFPIEIVNRIKRRASGNNKNTEWTFNISANTLNGYRKRKVNGSDFAKEWKYAVTWEDLPLTILSYENGQSPASPMFGDDYE